MCEFPQHTLYTLDILVYVHTNGVGLSCLDSALSRQTGNIKYSQFAELILQHLNILKLYKQVYLLYITVVLEITRRKYGQNDPGQICFKIGFPYGIHMYLLYIKKNFQTRRHHAPPDGTLLDKHPDSISIFSIDGNNIIYLNYIRFSVKLRYVICRIYDCVYFLFFSANNFFNRITRPKDSYGIFIGQGSPRLGILYLQNFPKFQKFWKKYRQ